MNLLASPPEPPACFRWGLIGPGQIAHRFVAALAAVPGARLAAVQARDAARGEAFAARWPQAAPVRVCATLEELLTEPDIDAVYIATPHAQHDDGVRAALLAGKPVLCEKPLVPTLAQGQSLIALARQQRVFLMEALWTRFLPAYAQAAAWLRGGAIGELRGMQSSFCFPVASVDPASRLWNPQLAGGSLLDIGIYNLAVTRWVLEQAWGSCPEPVSIQAQARMAPTGVDAAVVASLHFEGGFVSRLRCGFDAASANACDILGSEGAIRFPRSFHEATEVECLRPGQPPTWVQAPFELNGFEGEIAEVQACVRAGRLESPRMPHAESLGVLRWMDAIRAQIGLRYPFEPERAA